MKNVSSDNRFSSQGFAIVSVLLIIVVLTIMVVAFLQSVRIDRLTAGAYLNKAKAESIARSATEIAINDVISTMTSTSGIATLLYTTELYRPDPSSTTLGPITNITRSEQDAGGKWQQYTIPLVSKNQNQGEFETDFTQAMDNLLVDLDDSSLYVDLNRNERIKIKAADDSDADDYRAIWQNLEDRDGNVIGQYAYIMVDEQAKLNPAIHTGQTRENYGETAAEIPISLGDDTLLNASEQTGFQTYFNVFQEVMSPFCIGQAFSTTKRAEERQHLYGFYTAPNQDVIPAPYPDAGLPKYNINTLATDTSLFATATERAENIGSIIDSNLPDFKGRDGGTPSSERIKYVNRIAASIVDYIDSDTSTTTVNGGEIAGKDLFPMVTTISEFFRWTRETGSGSGPYTATIASRVYVQIWNPYTQTLTGTPGIRMLNRPRLSYGTAIVTPFPDYTETLSSSITIRPNEFKVIEFPLQDYDFISPTGPNNSGTARPGWNNTVADASDQTTHPYFEFSWDSVIVDRSRRDPVTPTSITSGLPRNNKRLNLGENHYQTNAIPTYSHNRSVGDPRFTYLTSYDWGSTLSGTSSYGSSTYWNGRNRDTQPYNQNFKSTWSKRDFIRENPVRGNTPGNINNPPSSVSSPYVEAVEAPNAPFYIRNDRMKSLGELGHIFDPAFADDNGNAPSGGTPSSAQVAGGGRTLRIGQPEFSYWDNDEERAIQLIDLFTTSSTPSGGSYPEFVGRININTAPKEVLDALFHQIQITSDQGAINPSSPPVPDLSRTQSYNSKLLTLSEIIIEMRERGSPFRKLSDLRRLLPYFATANAYSPPLGAGSGTTAPEVMDRAREEFFAKFINLVTLRSNNYRIYVIARSLSPAGTVLATAHGETIVELYPATDGSGALTINPVIAYERYQ